MSDAGGTEDTGVERSPQDDARSGSEPGSRSRSGGSSTPGGPAEGVFDPSARDALRTAIAEADHNEVFVIGSFTDDICTHIEVVARGNASSVLVFLDRALPGSVLIHNHPSGNLTPSRADFTVASEAGMRGLGFWIVDNDVERVYRVVEPIGELPDASIDPSEIDHIFGPDGPFFAEMDGYEDREGQREMAKSIAAAFTKDTLIACEAGTGVGKSFAYLIPAILWAIRAQGRVVISTQTIALSEQLIEKDLPRLRRLLDLPFQFALLKGRGNYACKRKTEETRNDLRSGLAFGSDLSDLASGAADGPGQDADDEQWVRAVADALERSDEGSLSSLDAVPPAAVWDRFQSSSEQSLKVRCPHYESCFFYEARRNAARAQIVVANHHLVLADLAVRRLTGNFESEAVLPPYRRIVFDEAHRLEDVAAQHFGVQLSRAGLRQMIGRLWARSRGRRGEKGRFVRAVRKLMEVGRIETANRLTDELLPVARAVRESLDEPFDHMTDAMVGSGSSEAPLNESLTVRLLDEDDKPRKGSRSVEDITNALVMLREEIAMLASATKRATGRIEQDPFEPSEQHEGLVAEFKSSHQSLVAFCNGIDMFCGAIDSTGEEPVADDFGDVAEPGFDDLVPSANDGAGTGSGGDAGDSPVDVRWIELHSGPQRNVVLRRAPVRVGPQLARSLYDRTDTACFTSATLTISDRWDYPSSRLGWDRIEKSRFATGAYDSPFDFERQAACILPTDLPLPDDSAFIDAFGELVLDAIRISKGRAFVLFTSHRMLRTVAARIRPMIRQFGYPVLVQGEAPVRTLLDQFRASGKAVLFGNQSFWEGVDVAGDALSLVIIARLPFRVPSHPLEEGRAEDVIRRGGQPFRDLTLPQSVLALKQGVGRLIRSKRDRGAVIIADGRISQKSYGKTFLSSLPPARRVQGPWAEGRSALEELFSARNEAARNEAAPNDIARNQTAPKEDERPNGVNR